VWRGGVSPAVRRVQLTDDETELCERIQLEGGRSSKEHHTWQLTRTAVQRLRLTHRAKPFPS
jgi:hypothetical protein